MKARAWFCSVVVLASAICGLEVLAADADLYVLSLGVEPSKTAKGKLDPYARDAQHVSDAFAAAAPLYRNVHQRVLNGANATAPALRQSLVELVRTMRPQDVAIIFFSAHGGTNPQTGYGVSLFKEGKNPWDEMRVNELWPALNAMKGRAIVCLDTCGAAGIIPPRARAFARVSFLTACEADASSYGDGDSSKKPHGYFVVALVEALRGLADANGDGSVTVAELEDYLPKRATELCPEQTTVIFRCRVCEELALTKPEAPAKKAFGVAEKRNPFGLPDYDKPVGPDVNEFARKTKLPGGDKDVNAEAWAIRKFVAADGSIEGGWESRWRGDENSDWNAGTARLRLVGERMFILYVREGERYLIEARKGRNERYVGRYTNVDDTNDTGPWVGRVISPERIDGQWGGGRWDLRRQVTTKKSEEETEK